MGSQTAGDSGELSVGVLLCRNTEISGNPGHSLFRYGGYGVAEGDQGVGGDLFMITV